MLTSTPLTVFSLIMESVTNLDPTLLAFWEGFPCPPPWKEELLFRLNWTGCVGSEVGEQVKLFMADKCNIRHDGKRVLPDPADGPGGDGVLVEDTCALTCQIIIGVVSLLFLVLVIIVVVFCVRRHRAKPASPSHQSSLTAHPGNSKYYTSCHYACAPVVARQLQTALNGERTETTVLPPGNASTNGHYFPGTYPQHSCQQIDYHHPHHHHAHHHHHHHLHHLQQHQPPQRQQPSPPCLIDTPYGQVPAHTSSLIVPHHSRFAPAHYRKLEAGGGSGNYSSSSVSNSDRSPVYESIGDSDSIRERGGEGGGGGGGGGGRIRDASVTECEFCECRDLGSERDSSCSGYHPDTSLMSRDQYGLGGDYMDTHSHPAMRGYPDTGTLGILPTSAGEDPPGPCPPMYVDGYYGDKCSQTLPLRPLRGHVKREAGGTTTEFLEAEPEELVPLRTGSNLTADSGDGASNSEGIMRRRPSSGSCYSNNSSHYKEGNYNGHRRPIPALHPHYFVDPPEEIS